jgi:hypothetical protein
MRRRCHGKRASRGEPAELAMLVVNVKGVSDVVLRDEAEGKTGWSEKLRGTDDGDKENLAGERLLDVRLWNHLHCTDGLHGLHSGL